MSEDEQVDFSEQLTEARRDLRRKLLAQGDKELISVVMIALTLSEHEAARRAVNDVLARSSRSNKAEA